MPIDVFITAVEKDAPALELAVAAVRKHIVHPLGTIYLVAPDAAESIKRIANVFGCQFVDEETIIPLRKDDIDYLVRGEQKGGWIYKMLLNLSADLVCANRHMLVLDADTIFIGPQLFLYKSRPLFNLSDEYHEPYFTANSRLLGLPHPPSRSFITHYMLFEAEVLRALRAAIEERWNRPWFEAILECIDRTETSGFAEYELYGDFYLRSQSTRPILNYWSNRSLKIRSVPSRDKIEELIRRHSSRYRSLSLHA